MPQGLHRAAYYIPAILLATLTAIVLQRTPASPPETLAFPFFSTVDSIETTDPVRFDTVALATPVDSICVVKHKRRMLVYNKGKFLKSYHISLGTSPEGHKQFQGDRRTPEGIYHINGKNPNSMAHKNLGISYPNDNDRKFANSKGKSPGGDIKIHGMVNGWESAEEEYRLTDWTWGCIAVRNREVDELYEYVAMGAPINIMP